MKNYDQQLQQLIFNAMSEDIGSGDYSTLSCIPPLQAGQAELRIKQAGIIAGIEVAETIFNTIQPDVHFMAYKKDGDAILPGEKAFTITAKIHTILQCERLVLNCMQRMSGIATNTKRFVDKIAGFSTKILDTRKTTPNFRILEKEAVRIGGGTNHRMGLYDMMMLKDNHIDFAGGYEKAINFAHQYVQDNDLDIQIEVETRTLSDVKKVCEVGKGKVFRILLDNFSPDEVAEAVQFINYEIETEASGGINIDNIVAYAATGVDYVSVGGLIHQAQSLDLSLKAVIF